METYNLTKTISGITNQNLLTSLIYLYEVGFKFDKTVSEQDNELVDEITRYVLKVTSDINSVNTNTIGDDIVLPVELKEAIQEVNNYEVTLVEVNEIEIKPQPENTLYVELLSLFNQKKSLPKIKKDKDKLVEEILDILIPKSSAGNIKGRMQKGKQKRTEVFNMLTDIKDKEELANQLVSWIEAYQLKKNKRNKVKSSTGIAAEEVIATTEEISPVELTEEVIPTEDNLIPPVEVVVDDNADELSKVETQLELITRLAGDLNVEYYSLDDGKVYIVPVAGRKKSLNSENVIELRKRKKDIYYNLKQNKNLTVTQLRHINDHDLSFANVLIDNGINCQIVKGYDNKDMSVGAIIAKSTVNISFYYSADDEVVIEGKYNKYSKVQCSRKQLDYFEDLGGEMIINNNNYFRVCLTFTTHELSAAIDLLKAGHTAVLQDSILRK